MKVLAIASGLAESTLFEAEKNDRNEIMIWFGKPVLRLLEQRIKNQTSDRNGVI